MYGADLAAQPANLLYSLGFGILTGVVYDVFRIIRLSFGSGKAAVFIQDLLFFLVFAFSSFTFILYINNGTLRIYIFLAETLGFFLYYFTLGTFVMKISEKTAAVLKKIRRILFRILSFPVVYLLKLSAKIQICIKKFIKSKFFNKRLLQKHTNLLYNKNIKEGKCLFSKREKVKNREIQ